MVSNDDIQTPPAVETIEADAGAPTPEIVRRGVFGSFWHRDFLLFWLGSLASNVGSWMQNYALGIVVFAFRGSEFDLGLVNFLSGIPVLFIALPAGVLADRVDRRKLIMRIQVVMLVQAAVLGTLYNAGVLGSEHPATALALVASLGVVGGVAIAFQGPAFQSMVPDLVPRPLLMNAIALNSAQFQGARMLGPLVAATLVIAGAGMGEIFYANAASFVFVIAALALMRVSHNKAARQAGAPADADTTWKNLTKGIHYAREHPAVGVLLTSTALVTFCGMPYMILAPSFVTDSLGAASSQYEQWTAFIMTASGFGALLGALGIASLPATIRRERIIPVGIVAMTIALTAFALSHWLWLSMIGAALVGAMFMAVNSLTNTSIQAAAPGAIRGRIMALVVVAFMGIMPLSGLAFGTLAQFTSSPFAVLMAAGIMLVWGVTLMARPDWLTAYERKRATPADGN